MVPSRARSATIFPPNRTQPGSLRLEGFFNRLLGGGRWGDRNDSPASDAQTESAGVLDVADDTGWTLRRRLAAADEMLDGHPTKSETDSHLIGLARHEGSHPKIDAMLVRLKDAKAKGSPRR